METIYWSRFDLWTNQMVMTISIPGINFIAQFEGFSKMPYRDSTGLPTIGYGTIHYEDGTSVTMNDGAISKENALLALTRHITEHISPYLDARFPGISQPQYDALCSFSYNLGTGALDKSSLKSAILFRGTPEVIAEDFDKWDMAGGHVLPGLLTRRQHEAKLFNTGQYI